MLNYSRNLLFILLIPFSCTSSLQNERTKTFDIPLMNKNHEMRVRGDYNSIIKVNNDYYKIAEAIGYKDGKAHCYINYALLNITAGNFKQAFFFLKKADLILQDTCNEMLKAILYKAYGELYTFIGLYHNALRDNGRALYYTKMIRTQSVKNFLLPKEYGTRGEIFERNNQDSALIYYHKARKHLNSPLYDVMIAMYHLNKKNNKDSVSIYINDALAKTNNADKVIQSHTVIYYLVGNYYMSIKDYPKAEQLYTKALEINLATKSASSAYLSGTYKALAELYKETGNSDKKDFYLEKYIQSEDKLSNDRNAAINIATEKILADIKKSEHIRETKNYIFIAVFISSLIAVIIFFYKRIKSLKDKKQILKDKTNKLQLQINNQTFSEVINLAKKNDSTFLTKFKELYPDFCSKLLVINPNLENSELIFCAMLKLNFTSKEISNYLCVQHDSVQRRKNRLRKRLSLPINADLYQFLGEL